MVASIHSWFLEEQHMACYACHTSSGLPVNPFSYLRFILLWLI